MSTAVAPTTSFNLGALGALGGLTGLDPISQLIDVGGTILGLPPEVKNIAKIAVGVATANPLAVINGVQGLAQNAAEAAATEYKPPAYTTPSGYAPARRAEQDAQVYSSSVNASANQPAPSKARCGDGKDAAPAGGHSNGVGSSGQLDGKGAKLSSQDLAYYQACATLEANFTKAETAGYWGVRDGALSILDLQRLANDPNADPELAKAALFFVNNPDRFFRLSSSEGPSLLGHPALVSLAELRTAVQKGVEKGALAPNGQEGTPVGAGGSGSVPLTGGGCVLTGGGGGGTTPVGGGSDHCDPITTAPGGPDPLDAILNNPRLSASEKAEQILMRILMELDGDMLSILNEIRDVRQRQAGASGDKKADAELASDMETLQYRLQKVMERRTQMQTLMSNMSKLAHEACMAAVNNTR